MPWRCLSQDPAAARGWTCSALLAAILPRSAPRASSSLLAYPACLWPFEYIFSLVNSAVAVATMTQDYKQGTKGCKSASCADADCVQLGPGGLVKPPPACQTAHKAQGKGQHAGVEEQRLSPSVAWFLLVQWKQDWGAFRGISAGCCSGLWQHLLGTSCVHRLLIVSKHALSEMHVFCLISTLLPKRCLVTK